MAKINLTPASELVDEVWGKEGTPERDEMEARLKEELHAYFVGEAIKKARQAQNLTQEELGKFEFSEKPLMISQITDRINALKINTSVAKLKATDITEWLLSVGILKVVSLDAKNYKLPSDIGNEMGISVERRSSSNGEYSVALYSIEAQKFIIDNLHAIVSII